MTESPSTGRPGRVVLGPIAVDRFTFTEAIDRIELLVNARRGARVFTPNVDHVVIAERNQEFREAYQRAEIAVPDGMPLLWASWLVGEPLPEKISGSDLVVPIAERAAARGWRVYLLGGAPGVGDAAAARLRESFPNVSIVGTDAPRIRVDGGADDTDAAVARILAASPDVLLVAFGAPKQELWIHRNLHRLGPVVALGIGAGLDFVAGRVRRAPRWISDAGVEWVWRLAHEPRRLWRRYLVEDPRFAGIVLRELRARARRDRGPLA